TNQGTVQAKGGTPSCLTAGGVGFPGAIRIECTTCSLATTDPPASTSNTLGSITAASTPALVNLPALSISSVGGVSVPSTASGLHGNPDVSLSSSTTNPITVTLTANHVPVPTMFYVKVLPAADEPIFYPSTASTGSVATSTATATVRLPPGRVCVLTAYAGFTQLAGLFPLIDGESVDQILVAGDSEGSASTVLITASGKKIPVAQLSPEDKVRVAMAFEAMQRQK
ncbi:MAG: hypothetical protein ACREJU_15160, partial [Nitrospiraceae bacterium]